jgi:TRAP-type C4-dicarboxylate transport system permease small subunit
MSSGWLSFDRISKLLYGAAAVSLLVIVVLMLARIASRNFGLGFSGLQLYAQLFEVWLTFLVVGALAWQRRHIEIDYFTNKLPERWQPYHDVAVTLVTIYAGALVLVGSVLAALRFADSTAPSVDIPIPLYYLAPIIGTGVLLVVCVHRIRTDVREVRR